MVFIVRDFSRECQNLLLIKMASRGSRVFLMENCILPFLILNFGEEEGSANRNCNIDPFNQENRGNCEFFNLYKKIREAKDEKRFHAYLRMSMQTFDYILKMVERELMPMVTNFIKDPVLPEEMLVITLV